MEMPNKPPLQLVSFHSTSKGFTGECGMRGGYFDVVGLDEDVRATIIKYISVSLCSNVPGQLAVGLMVNPPAEGDASRARHVAERDAILASLARRADVVQKALDALDGVSCNRAQGAMYLFPRVRLPKAAVVRAAQP